MARYEVTSPDGQKFEVTAPDGASQEQVLKFSQAQFKQRQPIAEKIASDPISQGAINQASVTPAEAILGSAPGRFVTGAAAPFLGVAQLGANVGDIIASKLGLDPTVGKAINEHLQSLEQMKRKGMAAAGDQTDVAGTLGTVLSPATLAAASGLPASPGFTQRMGPLADKMWQGAQVGGNMGLATPVNTGSEDYWRNKVQQNATGLVTGALTPLAVAGAQKIGSGLYHALVEPWANPTMIKGRAFLDAAGDKADEIIALLRANKQIVPGAAPTAGEAAVPAGRAEFAALQRSASNAQPSAYLQRADQQNAARIAALRTVGQDKGALDAAIASRSKAAGPLYQAAREGTAPVDASAVLNKVNGILAKNPGNRELVVELQNIKKGLLTDTGQLRTDPQEISSVLDGLKTSIANRDNTFIRGQLTNIKDQLAKAIPGYEEAQKVFAEKSAPVNQMQIGQYLESKLVPALDEGAKQKAATFATALREAPTTIKRATGAPRFDELTQALTPEQMSVVNSVKEDLARGARFDTMATKGAQAAPDSVRLATESVQGPAGGRIPNLLSRPMMVANAIISRLEGKINRKLAAEIATEMLNPPQVAESMSQALARQARNKVIANAVSQYQLPAAAAASQIAAKEGQSGQ